MDPKPSKRAYRTSLYPLTLEEALMKVKPKVPTPEPDAAPRKRGRPKKGS